MSVRWQVSPEGLEVGFYRDVQELLHLSPFDWVVTCGFRSVAESNRLHKIYLAGGPRAAPGGFSPHNIGEAVDIVLDGSKAPGLQMDWDTGHAGWQWLFDHVKMHPRLHSGISFGDAPHIESVKFTRNKKRDVKTGFYYIPVQGLRYLTKEDAKPIVLA